MSEKLGKRSALVKAIIYKRQHDIHWALCVWKQYHPTYCASTNEAYCRAERMFEYMQLHRALYTLKQHVEISSASSWRKKQLLSLFFGAWVRHYTVARSLFASSVTRIRMRQTLFQWRDYAGRSERHTYDMHLGNVYDRLVKINTGLVRWKMYLQRRERGYSRYGAPLCLRRTIRLWKQRISRTRRPNRLSESMLNNVVAGWSALVLHMSGRRNCRDASSHASQYQRRYRLQRGLGEYPLIVSRII